MYIARVLEGSNSTLHSRKQEQDPSPVFKDCILPKLAPTRIKPLPFRFRSPLKKIFCRHGLLGGKEEKNNNTPVYRKTHYYRHPVLLLCGSELLSRCAKSFLSLMRGPVCWAPGLDRPDLGLRERLGISGGYMLRDEMHTFWQ